MRTTAWDWVAAACVGVTRFAGGGGGRFPGEDVVEVGVGDADSLGSPAKWPVMTRAARTASAQPATTRRPNVASESLRRIWHEVLP